MRKIFKLLLSLLILCVASFSQNLKNNNDIENNINNYYNYIDQDKSIIEQDTFYFDNINNNIIYYRFNITKDSDELFFDYQSEYGCLYISIGKEVSINESDFTFCSEGKNNIFNLTKNNILEKVEHTEKDTIEGLNIYIGVGYSLYELDKNIIFDYSLKISYRKTGINIFEINSEHKILCNPEKINDDNYGCLFVYIYNNNDTQNVNDLLIYTSSQNNEIYADYINKDEYNNWNITYLSDNIPNLNSPYNNCMRDIDYINIPHFDSDKYVYIFVKSNTEETIEVISQTMLNEEEIKFPKMNEMKIYSINSDTNLDFNNLSINNISLTLITLNGKASIYLGNDESTEYITDIKENKLMFMINITSCKSENKCRLQIKNLEENNNYIFYILYTNKSNNNILNELIYGKSNKLFYNDYKYPIMLYEKIPNINETININIQLYNILEINSNIFEIEALILSEKEIYELKLNFNNISNYKNRIKGKFDPAFSASNIYITTSQMKTFNINYESFLLIYITNKSNIDKNNIIIGSFISHVNNLINNPEQIYHYGQINNEERIVYKLKGKENYHLMRLEFSSNSEYIGWSVRRTNDYNDYMKNDTGLPFITEKWSNGRELLTMYIENGEDIYLSVFFKDMKNVYPKLSNHAFKYINSLKNSNFKNYIIKNDLLDYNKEDDTITINILNDIPSSSNVYYYLKIINENDYVNNEIINTIAILASNISTIIKGEKKNNKIIFNLHNKINKNNIYYINAYSIIIENNYDIEYVSYSDITINTKIKEKISYLGLVISSLFIGLFIILILFISFIRYCVKKRKRTILKKPNDLYIIERDSYYSKYDDDSIDDDFNTKYDYIY